MKQIRYLILSCLLAIPAVVNAQLITNFGTNAQNGGGWSYNSGSSTLTGTEGLGDLLFGTPSFSDYTGAQFISLNLNVTTAPNSGFAFVLQDGQGDEIQATFDWNSFIGGSTQQSALSVNPLFNYNNVVGWNLVGGGSGTAINATLTSATAVVPEPTTMGLLIGGMTVFMSFRRRRSA